MDNLLIRSCLFASASLLAACATSPPPSKTGPRAEGTITWIGGPTAVLERGVRVMTDPMLGPRGPAAFVLPRHPSTGEVNAAVARYVQPASVPPGRLDAVLLSHVHADHFDDTAKRLLPKDTRFLLPPTAVESVRAAGFTNLTVLDWGEETEVVHGAARLRVTAVPAHHAHDPALDAQIGRANGWLLRFEDPQGAYVVYITGDAVLSPEMGPATSGYGTIDLFVPHLGAVGGDRPGALRTMPAAEALTAFLQVQARVLLPIHHTTFGHYREPIEALQEQASEAGLATRVRIVRPGEPTPFPGG